ncbi:hypothetical protein TNCV_2797021 [Trichonephila clavipes]|nr:hypothetical protein TNCV_2797021 [Trichonephila clavipes]
MKAWTPIALPQFFKLVEAIIDLDDVFLTLRGSFERRHENGQRWFEELGRDFTFFIGHSESPDLNPFENIWDEIEQGIR